MYRRNNGFLLYEDQGTKAMLLFSFISMLETAFINSYNIDECVVNYVLLSCVNKPTIYMLLNCDT